MTTMGRKAVTDLSMWVVTRNPTDYPGQFVAREWLIGGEALGATLNHHVADTLDDVRDMIPPGLVQVDRHPKDAPVIVECWF